MSKIAILYYHRINNLATDYNLTNVKPAHFEEHMSVIAGKYDVIPLESLFDKAVFRRKRNSVVVTFDDGYKDVLYNAAPILKAQGFSFTCLVTTGNINVDNENWTDIVTRVAFEPEVFRESCELVINGKKYIFKTGSIEERVDFYRGLQQLYKQSTYETWENIVVSLFEWFGISIKVREAFRMLNEAEINEIQDCGGIIGAHTVTHPFLSSLSDSKILNELLNSKQMLEKITGNKVYSFSYPFGDTPKKVRPLLEKCGYSVALTSNVGVVTDASDIMYLPRIPVRDYSKSDFEKYLDSMFV